MSALDNTAMQALSDAGAQCGDCGDQPGDRICPACELHYGWCVAALRTAGWAPRVEVLNEAAEVAVRFARACGDSEAGQYAASVAARIGAELRLMAAAGQAPAPQPETAPDFYQPGHTYAAQQGWKFRVDTITTHPEDGERTALGWRFWNDTWEPYAYGEGDWEIQQLNGHTDVIASAETPGAES